MLHFFEQSNQRRERYRLRRQFVLFRRKLYFPPQDQDFPWSGDADLHLGAGNFQDFDLDIVADEYRFTRPPPDYEHEGASVPAASTGSSTG